VGINEVSAGVPVADYESAVTDADGNVVTFGQPLG
jgi:hypothetical protein